MSIKFRWLGYVCYEIVLPSGKVLVTDPFIDYSPASPIKTSQVTGADYIAITHGDFDHMADLGTLVEKFNSKVICSNDITTALCDAFDLGVDQVIKVRAGDKLVFDDLQIQVIKSEHPHPSYDKQYKEQIKAEYKRLTGKEPEGIKFKEIIRRVERDTTTHPTPKDMEYREYLRSKGVIRGEQLGFVFQANESLRVLVYGCGQYDYLRAELAKVHANVSLLQLSPGYDLDKWVEFFQLTGAEVAMPCHHDHDSDMVRRLAETMAGKSRAQFLDPVPGKWYEVGVKISSL